MKKLLFSIVCVVASFFVANAQELGTCEWPSYGLSFKVPTNLNVIQNTDDTFEIDNESFNILLNVGKFSEDMDGEALGEALVEYATNQGLDIKEATVQSFGGEGYEGFCIEGDRKNDCGCYAILCNESKQLLIFVAITYANGYEETANDIVNSFSFE